MQTQTQTCEKQIVSVDWKLKDRFWLMKKPYEK